MLCQHRGRTRLAHPVGVKQVWKCCYFHLFASMEYNAAMLLQFGALLYITCGCSYSLAYQSSRHLGYDIIIQPNARFGDRIHNHFDQVIDIRFGCFRYRWVHLMRCGRLCTNTNCMRNGWLASCSASPYCFCIWSTASAIYSRDLAGVYVRPCLVMRGRPIATGGPNIKPVCTQSHMVLPL